MPIVLMTLDAKRQRGSTQALEDLTRNGFNESLEVIELAVEMPSLLLKLDRHHGIERFYRSCVRSIKQATSYGDAIIDIFPKLDYFCISGHEERFCTDSFIKRYLHPVLRDLTDNRAQILVWDRIPKQWRTKNL